MKDIKIHRVRALKFCKNHWFVFNAFEIFFCLLVWRRLYQTVVICRMRRTCFANQLAYIIRFGGNDTSFSSRSTFCLINPITNVSTTASARRSSYPSSVFWLKYSQHFQDGECVAFIVPCCFALSGCGGWLMSNQAKIWYLRSSSQNRQDATWGRGQPWPASSGNFSHKHLAHFFCNS